MEQRRLRLGDILDDYCPRERRVTNHAVVAMIEEDVKQTRCTTCDAEHAYKGARVPKRRKKEAPAALYKEVLASVTDEHDGIAASTASTATATDDSDMTSIPAALLTDSSSAASRDETVRATDEDTSRRDVAGILRRSEEPRQPVAVAPLAAVAEPDAVDELEAAPVVDGPVHRPLIRATLPRPEGQKDARPVPEFTMRHAPARGSGHGHGHGNGNPFRGDRMRMRGNGNGSGNGHGNGNRAHGGPRFHGGSGNRPQGSGRNPMGRGGSPSGFRNGNSGPNGKRGRGSRG